MQLDKTFQRFIRSFCVFIVKVISGYPALSLNVVTAVDVFLVFSNGRTETYCFLCSDWSFEALTICGGFFDRANAF